MTLDTMLVSLNKSSKPLLIIRYNPRVIYCFLKYGCIAFSESNKMLFDLFSTTILMYAIQIEKCKTYAVEMAEVIKIE